MPEFNFVAEIGGVDTSDPSRAYKAEEQKAVLDYIYGDTGPQGSLVLPSQQELHIGQRTYSEKYSIGRGSGVYHGLPALFVPRTGERALLVIQNGSGFDANGLDAFEGFLAVSVGKLLSLGKHSMREAVADRRIDFEPKASPEHAQARDYLTQYIIGDALFSAEEDVDEEDLAGFSSAINDFLGEELVRLERTDITDGEGGAFEEYTIELIRRICLVTRTEV